MEAAASGAMEVVDDAPSASMTDAPPPVELPPVRLVPDDGKMVIEDSTFLSPEEVVILPPTICGMR
jgi:hypothetical protein